MRVSNEELRLLPATPQVDMEIKIDDEMIWFQVIIVVNDEARRHLPQEMKMAIQLTIYEAKGLEFDDILLYNFFKDSQVKLRPYT